MLARKRTNAGPILLAGLLCLSLPAGLQAATEGRILSGHEIEPAAGGEMAGELAVFESVGQGIELSLAACGQAPDCTPALSETELAKLIETLDSRIDRLNNFDESTEAGVDYDSLLNNYRRTREVYALYMRELRDIRRGVADFAEEEIVEEPVTKEAAVSRPEKSARLAPEPEQPPKPKFKNEDYSIETFEDVDELIRSE